MDVGAKPHIVVIGSSNSDLVIQAPRLPKPGETVTGALYADFRGGKGGANQAVAAARAGARVTFLGRVGEDDRGSEMLSALQAEGIDTSHVEVAAGEASGLAVIVVDAAGENQIIVAEGANRGLSNLHIDEVAEMLGSSDIAVAQLEIPLETVCHLGEVCESCGTTLILNPSPAGPIPQSLLRCVDVLVPNLVELETITGSVVETVEDIEEAARSLLRQGVGSVVVTQGRDGSLAATPDECWWVKSLPVDGRDRVGAGDCFVGALAVGLGEGKPLKEAVNFATVAAGISVTTLGAADSMPYRDEIESMMGGD